MTASLVALGTSGGVTTTPDDISHGQFTSVVLDSLRMSHAMKREPVPGHVAMLASVLDDCEPITITQDLLVVDGYQRIAAARQLGRTTLPARIVHLNDAGAAVEAIRLNSRHGLPYTAKQRRAGVAHLLSVHGEWTDGRIAAHCGVGPAVVARVRRAATCSDAPPAEVNSRLGADGKRYPIDPAGQRAHAERIAADRPDCSVRDLHRETGVSVGTANAILAATRQRSEPAEPSAPRGVRRFIGWLRRAFTRRLTGSRNGRRRRTREQS